MIKRNLTALIAAAMTMLLLSSCAGTASETNTVTSAVTSAGVTETLAAEEAAPVTETKATDTTAAETDSSLPDEPGKPIVTAPFMRIDRDDPEAWKGDIDNLRLLKKGLYKFGKASDKYGIDPDFVPSEQGLYDLCISGSAQFSAPQLKKLAETLRGCADGREIYIIDLRQESHVFVNEGIPLSWYGSHNWANAGKTLEEIESDEQERFGALVGQDIKVYGRDDDTAINETELHIDSFMTEKELVDGEGLHYFRLPIQDHTFPTAEEIDEFIAFVKSIDPERSWLHFHCQGGKGRTTA